jgi:DNA-directed RNA polymerase subunit RPC12/RpoP
MVNNSVPKKSNYRCFQCGSELIFVSQETVQPEGMRYPQINTVYRCSNEECQKKKDKEKLEREKLRLNREVTEKERMEKIQEKRKQAHESKLQGQQD